MGRNSSAKMRKSFGWMRVSERAVSIFLCDYLYFKRERVRKRERKKAFRQNNLGHESLVHSSELYFSFFLFCNEPKRAAEMWWIWSLLWEFFFLLNARLKSSIRCFCLESAVYIYTIRLACSAQHAHLHTLYTHTWACTVKTISQSECSSTWRNSVCHFS